MSELGSAFETQLRAFNSLDLDSFVSAYHPDAVISRDQALELNGREEIRAFYQERFTDKSLHCDVLERIELGARWIVAHERVSSSNSNVEVVAVFEIENHLITRAKMLTSSAGDHV